MTPTPPAAARIAPRRLQLSLLALSATSMTIAAAVVLGGAVGELLATPEAESPILVFTIIVQPIWLVSMAFVALLLTLKRPSNRIGWLLLVLGPLLGFVTGVWAFRWPVPVGWEAEYAYLSVVASFLAVALFAAGLPLLFPDGRLPSRRWRSPVAITSVVFLAGACLSPLAPGYLMEAMPPQARGSIDIAHFGIPALEPVGAVLQLASLGGLIGLIAIGVASLVVRGRHGGPVVRAQLRWLLLAVGLILLGMASSAIESTFDPMADTFGVVFVFLGFVMTPIAVGIAVLRYRLYDIDLIIRRTLVYGALTVTLGSVYAGSILLLQAGLAPLTQGDGLAIAVSTLAVSALFQPLRRRIQRAVDRRFYRSRYDARRTLESFGARLRQEVDLDRLAAELGDVVGETLQPASVSVWLRARHS